MENCVSTSTHRMVGRRNRHLLRPFHFPRIPLQPHRREVWPQLLVQLLPFSGINPQPFVPNETGPIVTIPNAPLVQLVTTPPLTRACAGPSQSSRQECQVQDLQSLLLLSRLLLNCTRTASFTILFLLAAL